MRNSTILVAEDEPEILKFLAAYLEKQDFTVLAAEDGESALKIFEEASPDMVITDIRMPRINGDILCQRIREQSDIPIIVMTGLIEESEKLRLLSLGADDYITKPFNITDLLGRLEATLNRESIN